MANVAADVAKEIELSVGLAMDPRTAVVDPSVTELEAMGLNVKISLALCEETELVEAFPPVAPAELWIASNTAREFGFVGLTVTAPSAVMPVGVVSVATPTTE